MGLYTALNTATTGLSTNSTALNVIGDNIANVNTMGFKASTASFQDLLAQNIIGASSQYQLGHGAMVSGVHLNFAQGALQNSASSTDLAINGDGFFVVKGAGSEQNYYTRQGQFSLDLNRNLVNGAGMQLQGYTVDDTGAIGSSLDSVFVRETMAPSATTEIALALNLDAETEVEADTAALIDTSTAQFSSDELASADFTTSMMVYDSLGAAHEVTFYFQKVGENQWSFTAVTPSSETASGQTSGANSDFTAVMNGTLQFSANGSLDATNSTINDGLDWGGFAGADAQPLTLDLLDQGLVTQYGGDGSSVSATFQDGYTLGQLALLTVGNDGMVTGVFSNGKRQDLAQIALATFQSVDGLDRKGNTLLGSSHRSGEPSVAAPGAGGRGSIAGNALELSNVDLETEFVRMISTQLGYQANSKVISTTSGLMQQLLESV